MEAKGKNLLTFVSIIMLIIGVIGTVIYSMAFFGAYLVEFAAFLENLKKAVLQTAELKFIFISGLLWSLLTFVAGITGIINRKNTEKANSCLLLGIILIIFSLLNSTGQIWITKEFSIDWLASLFVGLIFPLLFILGAKLNKASN